MKISEMKGVRQSCGEQTGMRPPELHDENGELRIRAFPAVGYDHVDIDLADLVRFVETDREWAVKLKSWAQGHRGPGGFSDGGKPVA